MDEEGGIGDSGRKRLQPVDVCVGSAIAKAPLRQRTSQAYNSLLEAKRRR